MTLRLPKPTGALSKLSLYRTVALGMALLAGAFLGCVDDRGQLSTPAEPPPPAVGAVGVSFVAASLDLLEGETVEVRIAYSVRSLAAPLQLLLSPLVGTASPDDFALSRESVEIPAGEGLSGELVFELAAAADPVFDEGDETVAIRIVPDPEVHAAYGPDLEVVIRDGGVSPCPGIEVLGTRPAQAPSTVETERRFAVRLGGESDDVALEFRAPYWPFPDSPYNSKFAVNVLSWKATETGDGGLHYEIFVLVRDTSVVEPEPDDRDLRFAFVGGGCEELELRCSATSCVMESPPT